MGSSNVHSMARRAWALARRDLDILHHDELREIGFHPKAIQHRVDSGRLHRIARGVYAVGSPNLTAEQRLMVAVKRCGSGAGISHLSAAFHWKIARRQPRKPHVSVPVHRNPRPSGIHVHRRQEFELIRHRGIPVTTVLQTLIDCAPLGGEAAERMVNQADARNLLRADVLRRHLDGRGEPGAVRLRALLDRDSFVLTDSELERLFVPIALRAGLPKPLTQQTVNGYRVDFYWPELGLIVEVDGLRYHRTALEQRRDIEREHAHARAGLHCCRFTYWQVAHDADGVEATLRAAGRGI